MEGVLSKYLKEVEKRIDNKGLVKHMIAVSAIMFSLAEKLGENPQDWAAVGLLHDIDLNETKGDLTIHGKRGAEILKGILSDELLAPIRRHNELAGEPAETRIDFALMAADGMSGLIVSSALVMPGKNLGELTVESVVKKFKSKDFAKNVSREKIMKCGKLNISLEEFIALSISAMSTVRSHLGL